MTRVFTGQGIWSRSDAQIQRETSRWGVDPRILVSALGYGVLAGIIIYLRPEVGLFTPQKSIAGAF